MPLLYRRRGERIEELPPFLDPSLNESRKPPIAVRK
jgi:hypothetical protein